MRKSQFMMSPPNQNNASSSTTTTTTTHVSSNHSHNKNSDVDTGIIQNCNGTQWHEMKISATNDTLDFVSEEDEKDGIFNDGKFDTIYDKNDDDCYVYTEWITHTTNDDNNNIIIDDGISVMTFDVMTSAANNIENSTNVRVVKEVKTKGDKKNDQK